MDGPVGILGRHGSGTMSYHGNAKVAEDDFLVWSLQQVLGLDITVNDPGIVSMLQSSSDLLGVGNNARKWNNLAPWMHPENIPGGQVVHDKKWSATGGFDAKIKDVDDIGVLETGDHFRFLPKAFQFSCD
jgi:hypothetical protein